MSIDRLQVVFHGIDKNGKSRGYVATAQSQRWINGQPYLRTKTRFFDTQEQAIQSLSVLIQYLRSLSDQQFVS